MRITLVISSLHAGGAERVMTMLAGYWGGLGDDISLITLASEQNDFYTLSKSIKRYVLNQDGETTSWCQKISGNIGRLISLRRCIWETSPEIIVCFTDVMNVQVLMATRFMNIPVVASERIDPRFHNIGCLWRLLRKCFYRHAAALVVQTDTVKQWVQGEWVLRRVETIANPLNSVAGEYEQEHEIPDPPYVLAIGRLVPQKGFDLLLDVFAKVKKEFPGWKLVILGEGKERGRLNQQIQRMNLADSVLLPGNMHALQPWFKNASLFAMPSRYEGFPNVLLEAMSAGVPPVCFDCPSGPAEILEPEVNGILVPLGDMAGFSDALQRLMADSRLRHEMAQRATTVNESFALPIIGAKWRALLSDIAGQKNESGEYSG